MSPRLVINLCTRERAPLLQTTIERTLSNIVDRNTILMVSIDSDDENSIAVTGMMPKYQNCIVDIRNREDSLGAKYNRMVGLGDVYMGHVDYAPVLTPGFDRIVLEAASLFPDGVGFVLGRLANASFTSLQAATHKAVELMDGKFYPEWFPYWFVDHWFDDIARMSDRFSHANVMLDCTTRRPGKTLELRDLDFWTTFFDLCAPRRRAIAMEIVWRSDNRIGIDPHWRKLVLENRAKLVEDRSLLINQMVRAEAMHAEMARGGKSYDERYKRIKGRALAEMKVLIAENRDGRPKLEAAQ